MLTAPNDISDPRVPAWSVFADRVDIALAAGTPGSGSLVQFQNVGLRLGSAVPNFRSSPMASRTPRLLVSRTEPRHSVSIPDAGCAYLVPYPEALERVREMHLRLTAWKSSLKMGDVDGRLRNTDDRDRLEKKIIVSLLGIYSLGLESGQLDDYLNASAQWRWLNSNLTSPDVQFIQAVFDESLRDPSQLSEPLLMSLIVERDQFHQALSLIARAEALLEKRLRLWRSSGTRAVEDVLIKVRLTLTKIDNLRSSCGSSSSEG